MKRIAFLGVLAMFMASSALAGEGLHAYKLSCHYSGGGKGFQNCRAAALVYVREANGSGNTEGRIENKLKVTCSGQDIYQGDADVDFEMSAITISAVPGPLPEVILPPGALQPRDGKYVKSSWLRVDDSQLVGFCEIRHKELTAQ